MKIIQINVSNYRNIDGVNVYFNPDCSYIIGENNLGKSNFLALIFNLCNGKSFDETDFFDTEKPIEVELELKLCESELGFFADNFSPDDSSAIKIRYQQKVQDAYLTVLSADTNESIPIKYIKKINYLKYETTSAPKEKLRLDTQKGAGLLMNAIVEKFISNEEIMPDFLNIEQINGLKSFINEQLKRIKSFKDYSIEATVSPNLTEMLTKLFYLSESDRKIETTGSGVQYITMATINVLCQIMDLYKSKSSPFDDHLYTNAEGKKILPLVLSIDEPEVHLHPYLQRSLIGYYKRILKNKDNDFAELIKFCFDIDGLDGQLIVVTHSTDALIGDYRNLIRFYRNEDRTDVISGANPGIAFTDYNEKHLIMHFPEIKEAFYSHCAVLIEGETEYGCISDFAKKIGISLDDNGICIINARGESSIKPLRLLLAKFAIPSVAIYDGDVKGDAIPSESEFYTQELCFEIEIVKKLVNNNLSILKQIVNTLDVDAENELLQVSFIKKRYEKMGIDPTTYTIPKKLSDIDDTNIIELTNMYSAWYMGKKGVLLGRIVGEILPAELIPDCYANALRKAEEVANNA